MHPTVLWIYIGLLLVGGLMGYLKAKSQVSLITSILFAAALALCVTDVLTVPRLPEILLVLLLVVFGIRYGKTKKFMPSGLMIILTAAALIAGLLL